MIVVGADIRIYRPHIQEKYEEQMEQGGLPDITPNQRRCHQGIGP